MLLEAARGLVKAVRVLVKAMRELVLSPLKGRERVVLMLKSA